MPFKKFDVDKKIEDLKKNSPEMNAEFDLIDKEFELITKAIEMRKAEGNTQESIAEKAGLSQQAVSRIEKLSVSPSLKSFIKYLDAAGLEINIQKKSHKSKDENCVTI